jgi:hypothetical protein
MSNNEVINQFMDDFTRYPLIKRLMEDFAEQWEEFYNDFIGSGVTILYLIESKDLSKLMWDTQTFDDHAILWYPSENTTGKDELSHEPF